MSASKLRLRPISDWSRRMLDLTLNDIFSGHSRIKHKTYVHYKIGLEKLGESKIGLGHSQIEKGCGTVRALFVLKNFWKKLSGDNKLLMGYNMGTFIHSSPAFKFFAPVLPHSTPGKFFFLFSSNTC